MKDERVRTKGEEEQQQKEIETKKIRREKEVKFKHTV